MNRDKVLSTILTIGSDGTRHKTFGELMQGSISQEAIDALINDGFCAAPASANHHGAYSGALFDHSLAVTALLAQMSDELDLDWEDADRVSCIQKPILKDLGIRSCPEPVIRIGMLHDLCKIDSYNYDEHQSCFSYKKDQLYKGHGIKSLVYAGLYGIPLTAEETACICYHMGAYETDNWNGFDLAIKSFPNVLFVHTADMYASKILGV